MMNKQKTNQIQEKNNGIIFQSVFGTQWQIMPAVFKARYGNHAFKDETVKLKGVMNITLSKFFMVLSPLLRLAGALVPYQGTKIPVTVDLNCKKASDIIYMNRTFFYSGKKPYQFNSKLLITKENAVLELMRFGVGIRMRYSYENNKVFLKHNGYFWHLFGKSIPLPLAILLGKTYGEEEMLSDTSFKMLVNMTHPLFGKIFEYDGIFEIVSG